MDNNENQDYSYDYDDNNDSYNSNDNDNSDTSYEGDSSESDSSKNTKKYIFWGIIAVVVFFLILIVYVSIQPKDDDTQSKAIEKEYTLAGGDKLSLEYEGESFSWKSSDDSIAIVTEDGQIEALKEGDCTITIKVDNTTYKLKIHVEGNKAVVESVTLDKKSLELEVDDEYEFEVTIEPKDAVNSDLTWHSSNEKVAKVVDGVVVAKAIGSCTITVKSSNGNVDTCKVTVKSKEPEDDEFDDIIFDVSNIVLKAGIEYNLDYSIDPEDAKVTLIWESSDEKVATVEDGKIKTIAAGTTAITARKAGKEAIVYVTVIKGDKDTPDVIDDGKEIKAVSISVNQTELNMKLGTDFTLVTEVLPSDTTNKTITYTSSNTNVVTVSDKGVVTAAGLGEATITLTAASGISQVVKVQVTENGSSSKIESISINMSRATLNPGNTLQLIETYSPADASSESLKWESSNPNVATVDRGFITAVSSGIATITVSSDDGVKATCTVEVSETSVGVANIYVDPSSLSLNVGGSIQLTATIYPLNTTNKTITWKSSNSQVATVSSNGIVTGKKRGNCTISATTSNGLTATVSVRVG